MTILFQTGTISGLLQGIYDGNMNYKTLATHGDIGLGTFNGLNGEMIALDGYFYHADAMGQTSVALPQEKTPFALVAPYQPTLSFSVDFIPNTQTLNTTIDARLKTPNIFYMIRIEAEIKWIQLRSECCQTRPYKPLAAALAETQHMFGLHHLTGTLITTRCPSYCAGVTIPGFHHHFISEDKKTSGHVFDLQLKQAHIHITPLRKFHLHLTDSDAFDTADLEIDTAALLKKTE